MAPPAGAVQPVRGSFFRAQGETRRSLAGRGAAAPPGGAGAFPRAFDLSQPRFSAALGFSLYPRSGAAFDLAVIELMMKKDTKVLDFGFAVVVSCHKTNRQRSCRCCAFDSAL